MLTISLDVTSRESIENARRDVEGLTGGKLDFLVNNAWVSVPPILVQDFVQGVFSGEYTNKLMQGSKLHRPSSRCKSRRCKTLFRNECLLCNRYHAAIHPPAHRL
jgi:hypothetical protein